VVVCVDMDESENVNIMAYLTEHGFTDAVAFNIAFHAVITRMHMHPEDIKQAALEVGYAVPEGIPPSFKDLN
jgi:hypothetical protein